MPDRTQTLLVVRKVLDATMRLGLREKLSVGLTDGMVNEAREEILDLPQPEHQGDEESGDEKRLAQALVHLAEREESSAEFQEKLGHPSVAQADRVAGVDLRDAASILRNLPTQPPAPVLSDQDKLRNAECWVEIHGQRVKDLEALLEICPVCENDFSGGGVDEPSTDCSNCNNLGFVLPRTGALSDKERERLEKERLLVELFGDDGLFDAAPYNPRGNYDDGWDAAVDALKNHLGYKSKAELPPPSDSQGDQERCDCEAWAHPDWKGCPVHGRSGPDCNPAPTQVEGPYKPNRATVPGGHALPLDARPDSEGLPEFGELPGQPEGGDEEDWPPNGLVEALAGRYHGRMPFNESHTDEEVESRATFRDAMKLARADLLAVRSFVPATSQDSSGLRKQLQEAVDRGRESERAAVDLEREQRSLFGELARLLGPRTPREGVTANDSWISAVARTLTRAERAEADLQAEVANKERLGEAKQRAETALEELAEEFERLAKEAKSRQSADKADDWALPEYETNQTAASIAREKAAKLKGGGE